VAAADCNATASALLSQGEACVASLTGEEGEMLAAAHCTPACNATLSLLQARPRLAPCA
jgi:hypothetical protein